MHLDKKYIYTEHSFWWMKDSELNGETEGLIVAAKDLALHTKYYYKHIMKQGVTDKYRVWHSQPETVWCILPGCQNIVVEKYFNRHNQAAAHLYLDIYTQHWYEDNQDRIEDNDKVTVLQQTDTISIKNHEKDTNRCLVIHVAIPSD